MEQKRDSRPNILFLFTDQQRWDTIGFETNGNKVTPVLKSLLEDGVKFTNTFTCQPVCGPARGCIQTGTYATENGIYRNGLGLDSQKQNIGNTIATWFKNAGYDIGYIGKWHLASNSGSSDFDIGEEVRFHNISIPKERRGGWEDYWLGVDALEHSSHGYNGGEDLSWKDGENPPGFMFDQDGNKVDFMGYRVDAQTDFILNYIDSRSTDKPWFLFTSFIEPHHQNDHNRYEGPEGSKERFAIKKEDVPKDLWGADWLMKGDWEENFPDYLGQCWSLDRNVGRMIEKLKEKGMYENTIIVYTSDHGSHFRTRDGEYKRNCTDGCLHIPMIVRGPGFKGGLFVDSMVSLLDIVPTIMKAADIPVPKHVRGNPLQKLVEGALDGWPDCIFAQVSETQVGRVIRTKDWKFSVRAPGLKGPDYSKSRVYMEDFLFDLQKDPHELHNLVDDPSTKEIRENLGKRLIEWISEVEGYIPMIIQHMETPEPQIFAERGTLLLDSENILSMRIGEGSKKALAMDIPLYELLEDVIGEPMIVDTNGKKSIGRFIMDEKDDQCLLFESLDEKSPSIMNVKEIFKEILRNYVNFSILLPSIEEKVRYKTTNLKYYILIHKE